MQELLEEYNPFATPKKVEVSTDAKVPLRILEVYFLDWVMRLNSQDQLIVKTKKRMTNLGTYYESVEAFDFEGNEENPAYGYI